MSALALTLPHRGVQVRTSLISPRMILATLVAFLLIATSMTPIIDSASQALPEQVTVAVDAVVPDFVADLFTAEDAAAWGWLKKTARKAGAVASGAVVGIVVGGACGIVAGGTATVASGGLAAGVAAAGCTALGVGAAWATHSLWY